jgi:3-deoxy-D-manno-octulosonate 8-phosphate phosphatase (KDO 8-P phosphatase)
VIEPVLAKRIRLVGLDVDGTMTDGGVYLGSKPPGAARAIELKRFDIQDGLGVVLLKKAGLIVSIVTGRGGDAARERAAELQVDDYEEQGNAKKLAVFEGLLQKHGVRFEDAAYVGDDLIDLPILKRVGLAVAVANAAPEVKAACGYCTGRSGGHGALREFIEVFLKARGAWHDVVKAYLVERGDDGRI